MKTIFSFKAGVVCLFFSFSLPSFLFAFDETNQTDIRSLALGQVRSLSHELMNPAHLSFSEKKGVGVFALNRFGIKELTTSGLYGLFPSKIIDSGFKLSYYGFNDYQLIEGNICLSKRISHNLSLGLNVGYLSENSFLEEKTKSFIRSDPGVFWKINTKFELALTTHNLLQTFPNAKTFCFFGMNYHLDKACGLLFEINTDFQKKFHLGLGVEYIILEKLTVRCGYQSKTENPAIGAGWKIDNFQIDAAFLLHDRLGVSGGIGVHFTF